MSWIVLDIVGEKVLLLSDGVIAYMPYHENKVNITWEKCSLRKWLNEEYYTKTFSDEEKKCILKSDIINSDNPKYGTDSGNKTKDNVFLLSYEEAEKYTKQCPIRLYVHWWLRTAGAEPVLATYVHKNDKCIDFGTTVNDVYDFGVRPAIWVDISAFNSLSGVTNIISKNDSTSNSSDNNNSLTKGMEQAVKMAKTYLNTLSFSYKGLLEQLKYEGFSDSEAKYGVDNCGADWNEQAVRMALSYLKVSAFSRSGLIEQLEYEGFTHEQAVYGVEKNGL